MRSDILAAMRELDIGPMANINPKFLLRFEVAEMYVIDEKGNKRLSNKPPVSAFAYTYRAPEHLKRYFWQYAFVDEVRELSDEEYEERKKEVKRMQVLDAI